MAIFNQKLSDEGLLVYVWIAIIFLAIFFSGVIYQNHFKMKDLENSVWKRVNEQDSKITFVLETVSKDKDLMLEIVQQNKDTEAAVARMEEKVIGFEKLAEKMEKTSDRISEDANNFQKASAEFSKVMASFTEAMSFQIKTNKTEVNTNETIIESVPTPVYSTTNNVSEECPTNNEGKRIWWTFGLLKRKCE